MIDKAIASGRAGEETKALAEYLANAGRGRPPFGAKHLWYEIGRADDEMIEQGLSYDQRIDRLKMFGLATRDDIAKALATYHKAMEIVRSEQPD